MLNSKRKLRIPEPYSVVCVPTLGMCLRPHNLFLPRHPRLTVNSQPARAPPETEKALPTFVPCVVVALHPRKHSV